MNKEEGKRELQGPPIPQESTFRFGLGWSLEDVVTGCKGFCVYRLDNITGCNQYGIQPLPEKAGASKPDIILVDENRLVYLGRIIQLPEIKPEEKPGGLNKAPK